MEQRKERRLSYTEEDLRKLVRVRELTQRDVRGLPSRDRQALMQPEAMVIEYTHVASIQIVLGYAHRLIAAIGASEADATERVVSDAVSLIIKEWGERDD